ncbi:hypothetical protein B0H13DRAFT_797989 [Mycena leptocephala]|nr:hypothetical protein B0H13DRAFT_797989 [Mycena leptocephala]
MRNGRKTDRTPSASATASFAELAQQRTLRLRRAESDVRLRLAWACGTATGLASREGDKAGDPLQSRERQSVYMRPWCVEMGRETRVFRRWQGCVPQTAWMARSQTADTSMRAARCASSAGAARFLFCGPDGEIADDRQPDEHRELRLDLVLFDLLTDGQDPCRSSTRHRKPGHAGSRTYDPLLKGARCSAGLASRGRDG